MAKIERSLGIEVEGWYGPRPGGGYVGETEELDQTVQQEAKILSDWLNREIEIRFNSDRESGGAWIKDKHYSTQLGLNAGLRTVYPQGSYTKFLESKGLTDWLSLYDLGEKDWSAKIAIEKEEKQFPKTIYFDTMVEITIIKKEKLSNYPVTESEETNALGITYSRWHLPNTTDSISINHKSLDAAVAWLKENVDPSLIAS